MQTTDLKPAKLPEHLFVSSTDGGLYDTRKTDWSKQPPLRANYNAGHRHIESVGDMKASLRNGPYAWPGGYAILYVCSDGGLLCSDCARKNFRSVAWSIKNKCSDGWEVKASCCESSQSKELGAESNRCDHCNSEFGELS